MEVIIHLVEMKVTHYVFNLLQNFFTPSILFVKYFQFDEHTHPSMYFVQGKFEKYLGREFLTKIEEKSWTSHYQQSPSQENTFCIFQNWM